MSTKKPAQAQPVKPITSEKPNASEIVVTLDDGKIREAAFLLSQQKRSYNDYIWMLAEADLKLAKAFPEGASPLAGALPKTARVLPAKIIDSPLQSEIKAAAEILVKKGTKVQDLHWFIAIRNFIYQEAKKK
jgi:hypothetical protein